MEKIGLMLEGGGMRGVYTSGVLEKFMERELQFPYVIGVSAGACNASSYLAKQRGRNRNTTIKYIRDPRYISYRNLFKERSLFGMRFLFDVLPNQLEPFDFDTFLSNPQQFVVVTTDAYTGNPVYIDKEQAAREGWSMMDVIKASSSLPFIAPPVQIGTQTLFDGGIADPLPIEKALEDGNERVVVVSTKDETYQIKPFRKHRVARLRYPNYPGLREALRERALRYNRAMDRILELEKEGRVFLFRPSAVIPVARLERDEAPLEQLYQLGMSDVDRQWEKMMDWMHQPVTV
ncbi:patatin-like phospholipase family protein [Marinicrinis sediminis]|uniref:Patatin family protein n=1 Tax=Marinicrinis sediminis TaxID=1652465 RepID=A0ABW5RED0_9BACL